MSLDVRDRRSALAASTADAVPAERAGKENLLGEQCSRSGRTDFNNAFYKPIMKFCKKERKKKLNKQKHFYKQFLQPLRLL